MLLPQIKWFISNGFRYPYFFQDSTIALMSVGNKDTYERWLGAEYLRAYEDVQCDWGSLPTTGAASVVIQPLLLLAATLLVLFFSMFRE